MTQITLQAYLKEIEQLIDDNRLTEAVAHCKHILRQHPRYIEAYRLLGKALLEQHEYVSATDIFQRILSADPEDFVAHVGLSIAYKAEELMNDAIWHMERAYEIQPYNTTIQHELRDLYAWRDGELKTRELHIPPIALARLHFNAGLYQQTINTLRATLTAQPDRVDARTLLAEALWRDDQRVDAVDVCLQLLETLPYCIKANAILSEIWLMTGRIDEAQSYLQKLQALTLPTRSTLTADTPVTSAFNTDGAITIPQQLTLEKLDKVVEEEMVLTNVPNWVDDLDLGESFLEELTPGDTPDTPLTILPTTEHTPDWLRALTEPTSAEPSNRESADVLDWLREVASSDADDALTIVPDLPISPALVETSPLPDWLSEVLDDDTLIPPVEPHLVNTTTSSKTHAAANQEDDEKWIYDDSVDAPPGIPDWMDAPKEDVELHPAPSHDSLNMEEFPDWLNDNSPTSTHDWAEQPPSAIGDDWFNVEPTASPSDQELSGWLDSLATPATTTPSAPAEPTPSSSGLPDWFSDLTSQDAPMSATEAKGDLPGWLADLSASPEPTPRAKSSGNEALPEWLSDLTSSPAAATPDFSPSQPAVSPADEVILPDWLSDLSADSAPVPDLPPSFSPPDPQEKVAGTTEEAMPDWLNDFSPQAEPASTPSVDLTSSPTEEEEEIIHETGLTAWLTDLSVVEEAEEETSAATHLPDWLSQSPDDEGESSAPLSAEPQTDRPDWMSNFTVEEETDTDTALPNWLSQMPQDATPAIPVDESENEAPDWMSNFTVEEETDTDTALPDWLSQMPQDATPAIPAEESENEAPDWMSNFTVEEETDTDTALPNWLSQMPQDATPAIPVDESENEAPDWMSNFTVEEETDTDTALPDWLSQMPQDATPAIPAEESENEAPDWMSHFTVEEETDTDTALPDWLSQMPAAATPPAITDETESPDWLETFDFTADTALTSEQDLDLSDSVLALEQFDLANLDDTDQARETTNMADVPSKTPRRTKADEPQNELDWLDELAGLPLDEPSTVPGSQNELDIPSAGLLDEDQAEMDTGDAAWLDALDPNSANADLTLDWLDQLDQPEVEESPTLSWLSEDDLRGQATNAYATSAAEPGEDLEEAMAWLESIVTDQESPQPPYEAPPRESTDELNWLDSLGEEPAAALSDNINLTEESPTTVEQIPAPDTAEEEFLGDLFDMGDQPESAAELSAAISWLDELQSAGQPSALGGDFVHAGPPPDDPEAAMAWLEQLAAAQAAAETDEAEEPSAPWADELSAQDSATSEGMDWLDELTEPTSAEEMGDLFNLDQPLDQDAGWLAEITPSATEEAAESLPNWLDELAETPTDEPLPGPSLILEEEDTAGTLNWLDELDETPTDEPLPGPSLTTAEAEPVLDWLDDFAAASPDDNLPLDEPAGDNLPAWLDELSPAPEMPESPVEIVAEPPASLPPAQPTYVPPTNISPEAAKILDMSDLFAMGDVEESEEDMAQAMAWMNELMGDLGQPAPSINPPPVEIITEPVAAEPLIVDIPAEEVAEPMDWLDELVDTPTTPVAAAAPEADEAMAWLDEIVADIEHEPVAAAVTSGDTGDDAMDWLNEIVADLGLEEPTPTPVAAAMVPVEEPPTPATALPVAEPEPTVTQPTQVTPPTAPTYVPPTNISAEAAKILDMSDLFEMGAVEESEEDMAQAMAWMQELMGDMGTTTPSAPSTPALSEPTPEPEPEIPTTIIAAAPPAAVVEESDSALNWLNELADLEIPISEMPNLDKPFSVHDLDRSTPTAEDTSTALSWLDQMVAEQGDQAEPSSPATSGNEDIFADLSSIPEDPDAAMDWLENLAAAQQLSEEPPAPPSPVVTEPPTPAVPEVVMDALAKVETRRERARTGPLRPQDAPPPPQPPAEETPLSLISELTAGDVSESLPEWLALDKINFETSTLSWLSSRDMDATGWLESEAAMVDAQPEMNLPLVTPAEPVRDEMPRREPESTAFVQTAESFEFKVDLNVGGGDEQFTTARQHLQSRHYDEAVRTYSTLLDATPSVTPLITELEGAVDSHPAQPLLRRLLGDAYMRNGQLQKALETYRKALDQL